MATRLLALIALIWAAATSAQADEVRLYVAASTAPLLESLAADFEAKTGHTLLVVPAASSVLARQIEQGTRADIFLSANRQWADHVAKRLNATSRRTILSNRLVLVAALDTKLPEDPLTPTGFKWLREAGPFAICEPDTVPCGIYAKAALENLGLWDAANAGKLIRSANARATLAWLERGEAAAGILYQSDARTSGLVQVLALIPETEHAPIHYDMVVLTPNAPGTAAFAAFVSSPEWIDAAGRFGFAVP